MRRRSRKENSDSRTSHAREPRRNGGKTPSNKPTWKFKMLLAWRPMIASKCTDKLSAHPPIAATLATRARPFAGKHFTGKKQASGFLGLVRYPRPLTIKLTSGSLYEAV